MQTAEKDLWIRAFQRNNEQVLSIHIIFKMPSHFLEYDQSRAS